MFKKLFAVILEISTCLLVFSACGKSNTEEKFYDQDFLSSFTKGLTNRWDLDEKFDKENKDSTEDKTVEQFTAYVNAELNEIQDYSSKKFSDIKLQEKAIAYINLLNDQKEALKYYNADYQKYSEMWSTAYDKRTQALLDMINNYNITFPDKYKTIVDELLTNAEIANENDAFKDATQKITDSIKFEKVSSEYGWSEYEAIIENTTDKKLTYISVSINLLDKDGIIIENQYAGAENVAPGQKAKLSFSTDAKFDKYEISADYYTD